MINLRINERDAVKLIEAIDKEISYHEKRAEYVYGDTTDGSMGAYAEYNITPLFNVKKALNESLEKELADEN